MQLIRILLGTIILFTISSAYSQEGNDDMARQKKQKFDKTICKTLKLNYLLEFPSDYKNDGRKWPLLIFLHGSGERGSDLELVKKHGPAKQIEEGNSLPFIVASPQCPSRLWWTDEIETLDAWLGELLITYPIDSNRVYLTGLSMGGFGAWMWPMQFPERFAAIAPVCGGGEVFLIDRIKDIPVWAFHGARDNVVPPDRTIQLVDALKKAGGNVQFTLYPEAGHDSWTETYDNPALYAWFLKQARK
jgi:predicted peptidase